MGRKKKEEVTSSPTEKKTTLFDLISYLTDKKIPWEKLTEYEKKLFNPYMVNRFLSMELHFVQILNNLQQYTLTKMDKKDVYKLFFEILPKQKFFLKYVKPQIDIPEAEIKLLQKYFKLGTRELEDYYFILMKDDEGKEFFKSIKEQFKYDK